MSVAAFISVLLFIDPFAASPIQHIFFYITLFLACIGLFTLGGLSFRKRFAPGMFVEQLRISARQSILLAFMVISLLALQSFGLLYWWVGLTLILFIITVEIFLNS